MLDEKWGGEEEDTKTYPDKNEYKSLLITYLNNPFDETLIDPLPDENGVKNKFIHNLTFIRSLLQFVDIEINDIKNLSNGIKLLYKGLLDVKMKNNELINNTYIIIELINIITKLQNFIIITDENKEYSLLMYIINNSPHDNLYYTNSSSEIIYPQILILENLFSKEYDFTDEEKKQFTNPLYYILKDKKDKKLIQNLPKFITEQTSNFITEDLLKEAISIIIDDDDNNYNNTIVIKILDEKSDIVPENKYMEFVDVATSMIEYINNNTKNENGVNILVLNCSNLVDTNDKNKCFTAKNNIKNLNAIIGILTPSTKNKYLKYKQKYLGLKKLLNL